MESNDSKVINKAVKLFLDKHLIVKIEGTYAKGNTAIIHYYYWQEKAMKSSPLLFNIPNDAKHIERVEVIEKVTTKTGYTTEEVKGGVNAWLKRVVKSCLQ